MTTNHSKSTGISFRRIYDGCYHAFSQDNELLAVIEQNPYGRRLWGIELPGIGTITYGNCDCFTFQLAKQIVRQRIRTNDMDFTIHHHGSITMLATHTDAALDWVEENIELEDWQWQGNQFAVEPRYLDALIEGIEEDGLIIE